MIKENNLTDTSEIAWRPFYSGMIPSDWKIYEIEEVFLFLRTYSFSRDQLSYAENADGILNIHYGDIHATFKGEILDFDLEKSVPYVNAGLLVANKILESGLSTLKDGDLIVADVSEDYHGICESIELKNVSQRKVVSGLHTFALRSEPDIIALGFRAYVLRNEQVIRELRRKATGTSVYGVSKKVLSKIKIALPTIREQMNIASMLAAMDFAIDQNDKLIIQKQLRKKWLMRTLLAGEKRIKGFTKNMQLHRTELGLLPTDWRLSQMKNIVSPVKKSLVPKDDEFYQQIGIRSHAKGIFYKEKVTGKRLGEKSVFWVEPDCLVVNIVFAWEHAIAKTTSDQLGMIASHRFPMFKPKPGVLDLDYLLYFFKSPRGKHLLGLASPGGAGRNKTLGQAEFLKLEIPLPSIEEQISIAKILDAAELEIRLLKAKTEKLRQQKKGMMQILLTGRKRLKINEYENDRS